MELITVVTGWVTSNIGTLLEVIGALAAIATLTPNKSDDKILQWLLDAVNFGAMNIGKSKNA